MKRLIKYEYYSWMEGCGCCSDSSSTYTMWEDNVCILEDNWVELCEDEEELREKLAGLVPFDVHEDSRWF